MQDAVQSVRSGIKTYFPRRQRRRLPEHVMILKEQELEQAKPDEEHVERITSPIGRRVTIYGQAVLYQAQCKQSFTTHEEKETDVNIALGLVSAVMSGECDVAVIMSGDTDLAAAVVTAKSLFPSAQVAIAFPYGTKNRHFDKIADRTFKASSNLYEKYQIPDLFVLPDGTALSKPAKW
jgi:hypothetical protein